MSVDYNTTLNLPKTDFPMRASLPVREPQMLARWQESGLYETLLEKTKGRPRFNLHDGPPFSNGNIHMGTAMNKILKDFINRYMTMSGHHVPYQPGWDNHGMPIESAIIKKNRLNRKEMSISEFRDACHAFAADFVDIQRSQFIRLGVYGDWFRPYLTMDPQFEASEVRVFGEMYKRGYIYKGLKPVYWCPHDETALAEAEIEYQDDPCDSIYVGFRLKDDLGRLNGLCQPGDCYFLIWTTTTWSLPGNLAVTLHPREEYSIARAGDGRCFIVASSLLETTMAAGKIADYTVIRREPGSFFEYMTAEHPFLARDSVLTLADYVTMDSGTGCVHTAPCHGADDFLTGKKYQLEDITPIDDHGVMTSITGPLAGMFYEHAVGPILELLRKNGALFAIEHIQHSYPHCWRCKNPILFRATSQWFCSVDAFKEAAVAAAHSAKWTPEWGESRMVGMIEERADWCISRQRHWGLPIPVFYCEDCGKPVCTDESIAAVAELFAAQGSNVWYDRPAAEILPAGFVCPHCGGAHFTKETDTLDGWFDSGSTHIAALRDTEPEAWPADLYLEGADQYRGWFQSSLLTSVATTGVAPYRAVLTHGWVVDGEGKAMHKSLGNSIYPEDVIKQYGADVVRLWVASSDYQMDVRVSDNILKQLSQTYLKIRNTCRFILGNLADFDPNKDAVPDSSLTGLDRWALLRLDELTARCLEGYERYEYHVVSHSIHNFYLDVIKDRLYVERADSPERRAAQTVMHRILEAMVRLLAPILAFTSQEIWECMPHSAGCEAENVLFTLMPTVSHAFDDAELSQKWDRIQTLRGDVNKALEAARNQKRIGKALEAKLILHCDDELYAFADAMRDELVTAFIVSQVELVHGGEAEFHFEVEGFGVTVAKADGEKCERCWMHSPSVGLDSEHPTLCARCVGVVKSL